MRSAFALVGLLVVASFVVPAAVADHPGSNLGLKRFAPLAGDRAVHHLVDVEVAFRDWDARWPGLVERFEIGTTSSGLPLLGVRVTDEAIGFEQANLSTGTKLRVYLDGGHHGNEYLGVELVMYYLEDLLVKAEAGEADTLAFLGRTEVYAVPIINVDGNTLDTRKNSRQVDPNRNYDFQWGGPGASDLILDFTYRGPAAFSEAEVRANADYGALIRPDLWITMHTGVAEFYWPWGWTHDPAPDQVFFESLEGPFENATNGRVDAMQAAELYLAAGATDDYGYGALGIPTFTYEVHEDQFIPVYGEPVPALIADQLAGLDFMVQNVQRMGAWVEPIPMGDGLLLENRGWGVARNVTVTVAGLVEVVPELAPGASVLLSLPGAAGVARVEYAPLLIETSKVRVHTVALSVAPLPPVDASVPTIAPLVMLAVVALGLARLRRR